MESCLDFLARQVVWLTSGTFDDSKQLGKHCRQPGSNPLNVDQADVAGAAFNVSQIRSMDADSFGQFLLGESQSVPPATDGIAEAFADIRPGTLFHCGQASCL